MKKKVFIPMFFFIIVGLMVSIFWQPILNKILKPSAPESQQQSSTPEIIQLKFAHDMPDNSPQHIAALRYADIVAYKTRGKVQISVFPNQELGTDPKMIEMARAGKLAITLPPTAKLTTLVPAFQVLDLPFLFSDRENAYEVLDGAPGTALLQKLSDYGLKGVTFWESGFKQFTSNSKIQRPEDYQGLNIRVMRSKTIMNQFSAFGATPVIIDFHKTYQALSDRIVDGQENPLGSIYGMKFYEVQSHLTISNHAYLAYVLAFSRSILDKLPIDIQNTLLETAKEITLFQRKEIIENERRLLKKIKKTGIHVYQLTDKDKAAFKQALQPVYKEFDAQGGKPFLNMIQAHLNKKHHLEKKNEIIIGLNADVVAASALSGLAIKRGIQLAISEINQQGGLLGKKLRLIVRDNSGLSARGRDNMIYFSELDNVAAVMCGIYSPIALAELDLVHDKRIVFLNPWAAATKIVDNGYSPNYVFRVSVRDEYAGPFLIEKALESYKKVALLLVNDGWGKGNEKSMTQALMQRNLKPVNIQWFNWGEKDMTNQLNNIERAGADVIILVAGAAEGGFMIKSMAARAKKLPVISHWGITGGHFWKAVNRELENVELSFLQSFSFFNATTEKSRYLIQQYFKTYDVDEIRQIFAPVGTAHAYDLVHLLAMAIKKAGTIDRPAVRDAMEQLDEYQGVVKHYKPPFTPERHDALDRSSFILCKFSKNGCIIPLNMKKSHQDM
jgi:tripartite ATP-independent transporter DctP family solute receptor